MNDAVSHFSKAVKLRPNDPQLIFNLATALQWVKEFEQAITYFERAIALREAIYRIFAATSHGRSSWG